jgi:FMN phosphatase YigB (HAD superfamily)
MAAMRISFDLDGVLADMDGALRAVAEREFQAGDRRQKSEDRRKIMLIADS